jgi:hypothetical protein
MKSEASLIEAHTVEYWAYSGARKRCNSKENKDWKSYGGRGVCFLFWSFADFLEAVGLRPSSTHMLDRENNNGHYVSGNVRWVTKSTSTTNQRLTSRNKSGHKGVTFIEKRQGRNKWLATICRNHTRRFLGWFGTKEKAIEARQKAEGGLQ